jgi:hypothetical protein
MACVTSRQVVILLFLTFMDLRDGGIGFYSGPQTWLSASAVDWCLLFIARDTIRITAFFFFIQKTFVAYY